MDGSVNLTFESSTMESPAVFLRMSYQIHTLTDAILGTRVSCSQCELFSDKFAIMFEVSSNSLLEISML